MKSNAIKIFLFFVWVFSPYVYAQSNVDTLAVKHDLNHDNAWVMKILDSSKIEHSSNPSKAYELAKQALEVSEQNIFPLGKSEALRRIGIFHLYNTDFTKALDFFERSLQIAEKIPNSKQIGKCLMNLGALYYDNRNYDNAITYYSKSLALAKKDDDKQAIANCMLNFGNVHNDKGEFKVALENYQNALKLYVQLQDLDGIAKCLNNIGNVYFYQNNLDAALDYYKKALELEKKYSIKLGVINALNCIAKVYIKQNNLDLALDYSNQSLELAFELNSNDDIQEIFYLISSIYKKKKDYKRALSFFQVATNIKESLYNEKKLLEFNKLESKYQLENKEKEIKLLKQDRILKSEQSQKEVFLRNFIIVAILVIFLGILSFILYRNNEKEKKINAHLTLQNKEIAAQSEALKTLNEELDNFVYRSSHDLKAPLTSVLGLISLLKMDIREEKFLPYVDKIKKSVERLMLVLQDLSNYSKNSRLAMTKDLIDFNAILKETLEELKHLDTYHFVKFQTELNLVNNFYADSTRLKILLRNLISNAIIHRDLELPQKEQLVFVKIDCNSDYAHITVQDNGTGIELNLHDKIYDMFFKGSNYSQGAGLGLYITKGIVQKMKGTISFTTSENEGTTFYVAFPNSKH
jgi:signal transduction histidine kinase